MPITISGSTGIAGVDGSASTPAVQGTDTNTGIYFGADAIYFTEGGVQCAAFDSSANFQFNSGYGSVATAYGCRAWVNFNGTGTVAIRESRNVTSITDNGTGDYTVNITTALPDANYSVVGQAHSPASSNHVFQAPSGASGNQTTTSFRVATPLPNTGTLTDASFVQAAIFR